MSSWSKPFVAVLLLCGLAGCHACGDCGDKSYGSLCLHCHKVYEQSPQYSPPGPWFADLDCCERTRAKHGIGPDDDGAYSDGYANDSAEKQLARYHQRKANRRGRRNCEEENAVYDYPRGKPIPYCPR